MPRLPVPLPPEAFAEFPRIDRTAAHRRAARAYAGRSDNDAIIDQTKSDQSLAWIELQLAVAVIPTEWPSPDERKRIAKQIVEAGLRVIGEGKGKGKRK